MSSSDSRITARFNVLKQEGRAGFIPFIMAGDPDYDTSLALMKALPGAGADFIELGMCFTDPMADGPAIQAAGVRALDAGQTLKKTLAMVSAFRQDDSETPIILMGYYNPIYAYGVEAFLRDAKEIGVDGLIVVDLPPEEDDELCLPSLAAGVDFIRLATPTTDDARLPAVVKNASGFIYYVSVAGVTGAKTGARAAISQAVERIRAASGLPAAVGFGVKTAEKAAEVALDADAVVVGSALVERLLAGVEECGGIDAINSDNRDKILHNVLSFANDLGNAVRTARE